MTMKKIVGMLLLLTPLLAAAQSGIDGTWRVDLNKVKMDPKPLVFELKGGMYSCATCEVKDKIKADGQDHKIAGDPYADTMRIAVVSGSTVERVGKKNGKVTYRSTLTISADGKTMTEKFEWHPANSDEVANGSTVFSRVGEPEPGAHAISGQWKTDKVATLSNNALTFTYAPSGEGLTYKASTGESYSAQFDGKDYPYQGDPGTTAVELTKIDDHTFQETYKRNDKVVGTARMTVSPDGNSLSIAFEDKVRGRTDNWVAEKQGAGNQEASK
jgi:hypothetical protein